MSTPKFLANIVASFDAVIERHFDRKEMRHRLDALHAFSRARGVALTDDAIQVEWWSKVQEEMGDRLYDEPWRCGRRQRHLVVSDLTDLRKPARDDDLDLRMIRLAVIAWAAPRLHYDPSFFKRILNLKLSIAAKQVEVDYVIGIADQLPLPDENVFLAWCNELGAADAVQQENFFEIEADIATRSGDKKGAERWREMAATAQSNRLEYERKAAKISQDRHLHRGRTRRRHGSKTTRRRGSRRVTSRSAGGGSSGDDPPDPPSLGRPCPLRRLHPHSHLAGRISRRRPLGKEVA